jgi:hypothetical protein
LITSRHLYILPGCGCILPQDAFCRQNDASNYSAGLDRADTHRALFFRSSEPTRCVRVLQQDSFCCDPSRFFLPSAPVVNNLRVHLENKHGVLLSIVLVTILTALVCSDISLDPCPASSFAVYSIRLPCFSAFLSYNSLALIGIL